LWGVRVTMRQPADWSPSCCCPELESAITDSLGAYTMQLACRTYLVYAKRGYTSILRTWPSDLTDGNCRTCPDIDAVGLVRERQPQKETSQ
jgi:hypothetical protein